MKPFEIFEPIYTTMCLIEEALSDAVDDDLVCSDEAMCKAFLAKNYPKLMVDSSDYDEDFGNGPLFYPIIFFDGSVASDEWYNNSDYFFAEVYLLAEFLSSVNDPAIEKYIADIQESLREDLVDDMDEFDYSDFNERLS